jgi:hypothetical protein
MADLPSCCRQIQQEMTMRPATISDVSAASAAGLALHVATLNMLVKSGTLTQSQADEAYESALRSLDEAAAKSPQHARSLAMARALVESIVQDDGPAAPIEVIAG